MENMFQDFQQMPKYEYVTVQNKYAFHIYEILFLVTE